MRKFFSAFFILFASFSTFSQNRADFEAFASSLNSGEVSFNYSFKIKSDVPLSGSGFAILSGASYMIKGNGLEIWCDGKTRWTVDRTAHEAYIEVVEEGSADYMANPAMLLGALSQAFCIKESRTTSFGGTSVKEYRLEPAIEDTGLEDVMLYLAGSTPRGAKITIDDGTETIFTISSYSLKKNSGIKFSFDAASLDSTYVVTDLR